MRQWLFLTAAVIALAGFSSPSGTTTQRGPLDAATAVDSTAPTLSAPIDTTVSDTTASGSVDTDEANGTLYWFVKATPSQCTPPTAANLKTGTGSADFGSQAVTGTGTQAITGGFTGLTASTAYCAHYLHTDAATNDSSISTADGFTTNAGTLDVAFQGRGTTTNAAGSITMNYSTVDSGSAPAAGDLVIWFMIANPEPATFSLPAGWTNVGQEISAGAEEEHFMIAKVVAAGDVSSPPTPFAAATYSTGLWVAIRPSVAATINGTPGYADVAVTANDPSSVNVNASAVAAPGIMASVHMGYGLDATSLAATWGAITGTSNFSFVDDDGTSEYRMTVIYKMYATAASTGENVTADQADKGGANYQSLGSVFLH